MRFYRIRAALRNANTRAQFTVEIQVSEKYITFPIYNHMQTVIYVTRQLPCPKYRIVDHDVGGCRSKSHKSYG
jgi:hypothetical protein